MELLHAVLAVITWVVAKIDLFFAWAPAWMPWAFVVLFGPLALWANAKRFAQSSKRHLAAHKKAVKKIDPTDLGTIFFEGVILQIFWVCATIIALVGIIIAVYKLFTLADLLTAAVIVAAAIALFYFWFIFFKDPRPSGGGHGGHSGGHH
jgi:hypothetical protein